MAQYPRINARLYSHASITIEVNNKTYVGISDISYSDTLEPGELRGTAAQVLGRTTGEYSCECSFTMAREDFLELITDLGDGFMSKAFDIIVSYAEEGMPYITDTIRGCRITQSSYSSSAGSDPISVEVTVHPMMILHNGQAPFRGALLG